MSALAAVAALRIGLEALSIGLGSRVDPVDLTTQRTANHFLAKARNMKVAKEVSVFDVAVDPQQSLALSNCLDHNLRRKFSWAPKGQIEGFSCFDNSPYVHVEGASVFGLGRKIAAKLEVNALGLNEGRRSTVIYKGNIDSGTLDDGSEVSHASVVKLKRAQYELGKFYTDSSLGLERSGLSGLSSHVNATPEMDALPDADANQRKGEQRDGTGEGGIGIVPNPVPPAIVRFVGAALGLLISGLIQANGWKAYYRDRRLQGSGIVALGAMLGLVSVFSQFSNWTAVFG